MPSIRAATLMKIEIVVDAHDLTCVRDVILIDASKLASIQV